MPSGRVTRFSEAIPTHDTVQWASLESHCDGRDVRPLSVFVITMQASTRRSSRPNFVLGLCSGPFDNRFSRTPAAANTPLARSDNVLTSPALRLNKATRLFLLILLAGTKTFRRSVLLSSLSPSLSHYRPELLSFPSQRPRYRTSVLRASTRKTAVKTQFRDGILLGGLKRGKFLAPSERERKRGSYRNHENFIRRINTFAVAFFSHLCKTIRVYSHVRCIR